MPSPPARITTASGRRSARAERRRQRILEAAAQAFAIHGFSKTTVEEISAGAGVSKGLLYAYFDSKGDLLDAVLDRTLDEWSEATWEEIGRSAGDAAEGLAVMHRASLDYARKNPVLRAMLQQDPRVLLAGHEEVIQRAIDNWHRRLVDLFRQGVESGALRPDLDIERTVGVIRVLHLAFIELLFEPGSVDVSDESVQAAAIDLMHRGVANSTPSKREAKP
jgi:AcrR family transcriptional regulator